MTGTDFMSRRQRCEALFSSFLKDRCLVIASNRGPVSIRMDDEGNLSYTRGEGGLVTALTGMIEHVEATWISSALNELERGWNKAGLPLGREGRHLQIDFVKPDEQAYDGYYNVISNPLLWFLQHSMWDIVHGPTIDSKTWQAWDDGYVEVNRLFAEAIARQVRENPSPSLVMLHDYHLYLVPRFLREIVPKGNNYTVSFFVHIPWPGTEDWGILPAKMRWAILDGLCASDLIGFQTREDGLNFIRSCESHLPDAKVNYRWGRIQHRSHTTYIRDFPISIDIQALHRVASTPEVNEHRAWFESRLGDKQLIVRIDRIEPSKNIVRGFKAFEEMLDIYPQHEGKVQFLALLVPSRMEVDQYRAYLEELMAAAGVVNARFGNSEWEPVRVLIGEDYSRAIAAMQLYDVLLVNSIADGMNLVAKEGPVANQNEGVVILSERTGARQQLEEAALIVSPCDIFATANCFHQALTMPAGERSQRAGRLRELVEGEDITDWLCKQLKTIASLHL
jgi:trehalose 6-phosphate synthase